MIKAHAKHAISFRSIIGNRQQESALLKSFDAATLNAARDIILDKSEWFGFDKEGQLINKLPYWTPEADEKAGRDREESSFQEQRKTYEKYQQVRKSLHDDGLEREVEGLQSNNPRVKRAAKELQQLRDSIIPDEELIALKLREYQKVMNQTRESDRKRGVPLKEAKAGKNPFIRDNGEIDNDKVQDYESSLGNLTLRQKKMIAATVALLEMHSRDYVDSAGFTQAVRLEAASLSSSMLSDFHTTFGVGSVDDTRSWNEGKKSPEEIIEKRIGWVAEDVRIAEGVRDGSIKKPELSEDEKHAIFERKFEASDFVDLSISRHDPLFQDYDPETRIRKALETSKNILRYAAHSGINIMRFHNSAPGAVNFIRLSPDMDFLLSYEGEARKVEDPATFARSYWAETAAGMKLQVASELLRHVRKSLGQAVEATR